MTRLPALRRPMHDALTPGQHVVITGGSSGLGLELAHRLAARGMNLTPVARSAAKLASAADAVRAGAPGANVNVVSADVGNLDALETTFATVAAQRGGIGVLINSAGILREGYFEKLAESDFRDVMDVNVFGTVNAIRAALPHLKASGGRVVNIASMAGLSGCFGYTSYCASKHALVGFTNSLRFELEPQGILVHLVCPGEFDSPMVDELDKTRTPENREHVLAIPKLSVEEIATETVAGMAAGRPMIIPGRKTRLVAASMRYLPWVGNALVQRRIKAVYRGPGSDSEHVSGIRRPTGR